MVMKNASSAFKILSKVSFRCSFLTLDCLHPPNATLFLLAHDPASYFLDEIETN